MPNNRTVVAIGDLHGDYHRAQRILLEHEILMPDTLEVNPERTGVDLVFLGDYVDWRGETLEGAAEEQAGGARRIVELVHRSYRRMAELRQQQESYDSRLYPLLGNHDDMMLQAHRAVDVTPLEALQEVLNQAGRRLGRAIRAITELGLSDEVSQAVLKFFHWYAQGGDSTLQSFGGLENWKAALDGDLGDFLRRDLLLGIVLNGSLYTHTAPDEPDFWKPLDQIEALPPTEYGQARDSYIWSRKIWGYNWQTGLRSAPFTQEEIEAMLAGMAVERIVIGHTRMSTDGTAFHAFNHRVVNIDLHGFPGSAALVEHYHELARLEAQGHT